MHFKECFLFGSNKIKSRKRDSVDEKTLHHQGAQQLFSCTDTHFPNFCTELNKQLHEKKGHSQLSLSGPVEDGPKAGKKKNNANKEIIINTHKIQTVHA